MSDLPPSYEFFASNGPLKAAKSDATLATVGTAPKTTALKRKTEDEGPIRIGSSKTANATITINGQLFEIPSTTGPLTSLAHFIRNHTAWTGTKIACNEGMCGACTVMIQFTNPATGKVEAHGVNACLRPVLACAGMSVLTNDGLVEKDPATLDYKFHEIQSRLAAHNGTQCGYCSNGFVMNMYDLVANSPNGLAKIDIERAFDGNLCRCTGYRPILDAFHTFANKTNNNNNNNNNKLLGHDDDCSEDDCRKKGCQRRQQIFPDVEDLQKFIHRDHERPFEHAHAAGKLKALAMPAERDTAAVGPVSSTDPYNNQWNEITTIAELNNTLKTLGPNSDALIVNAATSFGVFRDDRSLTNTKYLYIGAIPDLKRISSDSSNVYIGGTVTIDAVITFLSSLTIPSAPWKTKHLPQAIAHLQRIAGRQIRNAGSLAGNIMAALNHQKPLDFFASDGSIVLMGLGATVKVYDAVAAQTLVWDMPTFFQQEGKMVGKYVSQIIVPLASSPNEVFTSTKVAMRQQGSHAVINAAMKATITPTGGIAASPAPIIAIGGVEVAPCRYAKVEKFIAGVPSFSDVAFVKNACTLLQGLLNCAPMEGRIPFRIATAVNALYKFFLAMRSENKTLPAELVSGAEPWPTRPVSFGSQSFQPDPTKYPVSKAMVKLEAPYQTSGLAKYTNDLQAATQRGTLQVRVVYATQACCVLTGIDYSAAQQLPGFVRFIGAADMIKGTNAWANGPVLTPIGTKIDFVGQVIGLVVCSDDVTSWLAALAVHGTYGPASGTPITTIQQAIEAKSYSSNVPPPVTRGDAATAFAAAPLKVTGSVQIGPQNHFFMENHTATCVPRDGEYEIQSATQMPVSVQMTCAQVMGVPTSKVTVTTKLVGGGFGGKISNSTQVAAFAAIASAVTGSATTVLVSLDQSSHVYGCRDVKRIDYSAGLTADGSLTALSINAFNASGAVNTDEFGDAMVFLHNVDNAYNVPNVNFTAEILLLNYAPVAACRGPGWVHAVHAMEAIMSDISSHTGIDPTLLREKNFYKQGDVTPDGMVLQYWTLPTVWSQLKASADFAGKQRAIAAFNAANRFRKRGLSMVPIRFGISLAGANFDSLIAIYPDGTVTVNHGGNEIGQGINTRLAQVVAYKFGISAENINVVSVKPTCTNVISAGSNVTGGSVTAEMCAASLIHAADTILRRLAPFQKPGQQWAELIGAASAAGVPLTATGWTNAPSAASMFNYNVCAASLTVAEVDMLTGQTEIKSTDMVYDCGLSTSPLLDIGQVEGGFVFGIGMLMTEEMGWDATTAQPTSPTHWKYKIPCSFTIPEEFNITLLKNAPNPLGVLGSKASGEPGVCMAISVPLALEGAITAARASNGLGSTRWVCKKYPLTVDKSQQACGTGIKDYV